MILDGYGCGKGSERSWGGWIRPKYLVQKFRGIDKEHLKREKSNKCSRIVKAQTHKKNHIVQLKKYRRICLRDYMDGKYKFEKCYIAIMGIIIIIKNHSKIALQSFQDS